MPRFIYQGLGPQSEAVAGEHVADSLPQAIAELSHQGISIESIQLQVESNLNKADEARGEQAVADSVAVPKYWRRIGEVLDKREELVALLDAAASETPSPNAAVNLKQVSERLRLPLEPTAFLQDPLLLPWLPLLARMVEGRDASAEWDLQLQEFAEHSLERGGWRQVWLCLLYPIALLCLVLVIVSILSYTLIPSFQKLFDEFQLMLPALTIAFFSAANFIRSYPLIAVLILLAGVVAVAVLLRWMRVLLSWVEPVFPVGPLLAGRAAALTAMGRFTNVLATMLRLGAPLSDAVLYAGVASRRPVYSVAAQRMATDLASLPSTESSVDGLSPMIQYLRNSPMAHRFPRTVWTALIAGPDGQPCIPFLEQLSVLYRERIQDKREGSLKWFGPIAVLIIGGLIGLMVIALMLPLLRLVWSLSS